MGFIATTSADQQLISFPEPKPWRALFSVCYGRAVLGTFCSFLAIEALIKMEIFGEYETELMRELSMNHVAYS